MSDLSRYNYINNCINNYEYHNNVHYRIRFNKTLEEIKEVNFNFRGIDNIDVVKYMLDENIKIENIVELNNDIKKLIVEKIKLVKKLERHMFTVDDYIMERLIRNGLSYVVEEIVNSTYIYDEFRFKDNYLKYYDYQKKIIKNCLTNKNFLI